MTSSILDSDFTARVESLLTEFAEIRSAGEDLCRRLHETLLEGYGRALALEGERRRLHTQQLRLADLPSPNDQALRELAALAQSEARLARESSGLRALVGRLRERELGLCDSPDDRG